jgi:AraC family transcriptional regulator
MSSAQTIATPARPASPASPAIPAPVDSLHDTTLTELARALQAHLQSGSANDPQLEQALLDSLQTSLTQRHGVMTSPLPPRASRQPVTLSQRNLRKAQEFIDARLATQFSIDDIARAACLSSCHLGHAWHQTTGQSLWQYVLQCRVALACRLISQDPQAQLGDIALQSGFESYSQFIAVFRKLHGVTPGVWRQMLH